MESELLQFRVVRFERTVVEGEQYPDGAQSFEWAYVEVMLPNGESPLMLSEINQAREVHILKLARHWLPANTQISDVFQLDNTTRAGGPF